MLNEDFRAVNIFESFYTLQLCISVSALGLFQVNNESILVWVYIILGVSVCFVPFLFIGSTPAVIPPRFSSAASSGFDRGVSRRADAWL